MHSSVIQMSTLFFPHLMLRSIQKFFMVKFTIYGCDEIKTCIVLQHYHIHMDTANSKNYLGIKRRLTHSQSMAIFAPCTEVILRIIADWASVLSIPGKHVSDEAGYVWLCNNIKHLPSDQSM